MSSLIPGPSKLVELATRTVARLLRPTRPDVDIDAAPVHPPELTSSEAAPRTRQNGKYDQRLIAFVAERPGATVAQAAQELDVHPTALYPVIRRLEARGQLLKRGRGLQLKPVAEPAAETAGIERLWCEEGHWWQRPPTRGPKPRRCLEHRR